MLSMQSEPEWARKGKALTTVQNLGKGEKSATPSIAARRFAGPSKGQRKNTS